MINNANNSKPSRSTELEFACTYHHTRSLQAADAHATSTDGSVLAHGRLSKTRFHTANFKASTAFRMSFIASSLPLSTRLGRPSLAAQTGALGLLASGRKEAIAGVAPHVGSKQTTGEDRASHSDAL